MMGVNLRQMFRGLLLWAITAFAWAEQVVDLYQTQSLIKSQSGSERARAAADGLAEVFLRVSGSEGTLRNPLIAKALRRAQSYMYEFRYESTDETLLEGGKEIPASRIVMKFSPQAVEKVLRQARMPMWPANRRSVVMWLVVDKLSGGRQLVGEAENPQEVKVLTEASVRRGLPVIVPLLDLEDRITLSADDAWNLEENAIRQASKRYRADSILIGRYSQTSRGRWRGNWTLLDDRQGGSMFDSSGRNLDEIIDKGVDQVAGYMASLAAIVPGTESSGAVVMQLDGIKHFGSYIKVLKYLESLAVVRHAELTAVHEDTLLLQLYTEGELALLIDALALDKKIFPVAAADTAYAVNREPVIGTGVPWQGPRGSAQNPLQYKWPET